MSKTRTTLTPQEWQLVFNLPADGETYNIPGVASRAKHLPRTKLKMEQVICETQYGTLRRLWNGKKWEQTDYIPSY